MSAWGSTATPTCGKPSRTSSITCLWLQSSNHKFSASTVVFPPQLTPLIRFANLIASKKCLTRDPSAICFGQIPMTVAVGASRLAVLATRSARTFLSSSTMPTIWQESHVPINLSWTATIGVTRETLWLSSQRLTIVTAAAMKLPLWKLTSTWTVLCKYSSSHSSIKACQSWLNL